MSARHGGLPSVLANSPVEAVLQAVAEAVGQGRLHGAALGLPTGEVLHFATYWSDDVLVAAVSQARAERKAAAAMRDAPLGSACVLAMAAEDRPWAQGVRPWPQGSSSGAVFASVVSLTPEDLPVVVLSQSMRLDATGEVVRGVLRWDRPGLETVPADLPGLVLYQELLARHPGFKLMDAIFPGSATGPRTDDGPWRH